MAWVLPSWSSRRSCSMASFTAWATTTRPTTARWTASSAGCGEPGSARIPNDPARAAKPAALGSGPADRAGRGRGHALGLAGAQRPDPAAPLVRGGRRLATQALRGSGPLRHLPLPAVAVLAGHAHRPLRRPLGAPHRLAPGLARALGAGLRGGAGGPRRDAQPHSGGEGPGARPAHLDPRLPGHAVAPLAADRP